MTTPLNTRPLSVALVSREYPPFFGGGIGTYARWIVPALNNAGIRVHVVTQTYDNLRARIETDGLTTIHRVPIGGGRGGWTNTALSFSNGVGRIVSKLCRTGQIDIVEYAECEAAGCVPMLLSSSSQQIPSVVQLHTPSEQLYMLRSLSKKRVDLSLSLYFHAERMALRLCDSVLAPSQFIADWAHAHYGLGSCPDVIPYATGVLPDPPPPASDDGPLHVLYIGRIEPRKGVESLFHAWRQVAKRCPDVELHLAGADTSGAPDGGSMKMYLLEMLDDEERSRVRFLGRLSAEALNTEYAKASLCVIPSLWENFPNTCIESMSHARAVLVGDQGGMQEMIGESIAGRTFHAGDEQDLQSKLIEMINEGRGKLSERGKEARKRIEWMCEPKRIAELRIDHYRNVIEQRQAEIHTTKSSVTLQDTRENHSAVEGRMGCKTDLSMLKVWKDLESTVEHHELISDMPSLSMGVSKWVQQMETSS
jgi:glycogen synthase